jgi:hypothetical protein
MDDDLAIAVDPPTIQIDDPPDDPIVIPGLDTTAPTLILE